MAALNTGIQFFSAVRCTETQRSSRYMFNRIVIRFRASGEGIITT